MYFIHLSLCILVLSSHEKLLSSFVYVTIDCVGAGIPTLVSILRRIGPVLFASKDEKNAVRDGRNGRKGVYFPQKSEFFPLEII